MRKKVLQVVLGIVGVLFVATSYPMVAFVKQEPALSMMLSLYVTLGVMLLLAVRDPAEHRSLIAFTAWSSFAHAAVMGYQAYRHIIGHREVYGVVVFFTVGVALLALAPRRP